MACGLINIKNKNRKEEQEESYGHCTRAIAKFPQTFHRTFACNTWLHNDLESRLDLDVYYGESEKSSQNVNNKKKKKRRKKPGM